MAYSEKVIDHYENPTKCGQNGNRHTVGTGVVGAPACGDVMRLQIKVEDGIITRCKIQNLRLRVGDCVELACHRVGQG
jgi:nitrogen fixation protein NifU and related proteins